ncbi:MAG TPA: hypothetical protein VGE50_01800 [Gammaproteobacteria bacterium]
MSTLDNSPSCPKCRAPLPAGLYEGTGTACPSCSLVFSKYRAAQSAAYRAQLTRRPAATSEKKWLSYLLTAPESVSRERFYAGMGGLLLFVIWGFDMAILDYRTGEINQSFLHGPLLIFHEAGHVIFRLFGQFATVLGGTLAQLLMPVVLLVALLRQNHDTLGASLALWLLGISLLDVAPYIYDAFAPQLVLLNGATGEAGGHDWIYILRELGILEHAHMLGGVVYALGILTLLTAAVWAAALLRKQWHILKNRKSDCL